MDILTVLVFGILLLDVRAAPSGLREGCRVANECNRVSPVCVIDEYGEIRSFENQCMADVAACYFGTYYVEVKEGIC